MDLGMKTRNNFQVLLEILVLPILGDLLDIHRTLLLRLADLDPLLHGETFAELSEVVAIQAQAVEQRAIFDRVEVDVVVWSAWPMSVTSVPTP